MTLTEHSNAVAHRIKKYFDSRPVYPEGKIAAMVQQAIESWVCKVGSNRIQYPRMRVGVLGTDSDSIAVLIQTGMDVVHCIGEPGMFEWCATEENNKVPVIKDFDIMIPYYPSFLMPPRERKAMHERFYENLLLGNPAFHPSCCRTVDSLCYVGSVIGPFVWLAPNVNIGVMTTIGSHCTIANDAVIGDYCLVEQNVSIAPGVRIGEMCQIGAGSQICANVSISPGSIIHPGQIVKFNR